MKRRALDHRPAQLLAHPSGRRWVSADAEGVVRVGEL